MEIRAKILEQIDQIKQSDLPGNLKASKIYSLRCQLRRLGLDSQTDDSLTWRCPKPGCDNHLTTHLPMLEVLCNRHTGGRIKMTHL